MPKRKKWRRVPRETSELRTLGDPRREFRVAMTDVPRGTQCCVICKRNSPEHLAGRIGGQGQRCQRRPPRSESADTVDRCPFKCEGEPLPHINETAWNNNRVGRRSRKTSPSSRPFSTWVSLESALRAPIHWRSPSRFDSWPGMSLFGTACPSESTYLIC
jgi:hypothetical protein